MLQRTCRWAAGKTETPWTTRTMGRGTIGGAAKATRANGGSTRAAVRRAYTAGSDKGDKFQHAEGVSGPFPTRTSGATEVGMAREVMREHGDKLKCGKEARGKRQARDCRRKGPEHFALLPPKGLGLEQQDQRQDQMAVIMDRQITRLVPANREMSTEIATITRKTDELTSRREQLERMVITNHGNRERWGGTPVT